DGIRDYKVTGVQTCALPILVSLSLCAWLTPAETNVLALKLERFDAGLLPCSAQWLLERISETARQHNIDVSWYRHEGHPVALIRSEERRVGKECGYGGWGFM